MLLSEWVAIWQPTTVNLRPSSRARDDSYLRNHVLPSFGGVRLNAIGRLDVAAWVTELGGKGLAPATVRKAYQTLSKAMRAAVDADLIADTPCRNIDLPELQIEEMRFLAPEDIDALAEIIHPRYRAMVLFDAYCGLRFSELAGLKRSAVNIQRGKVRVVHNAVEVRGTIEWGAPQDPRRAPNGADDAGHHGHARPAPRHLRRRPPRRARVPHARRHGAPRR